MKQFLKANYRFVLCAMTGMICGFAIGFLLYPTLISSPNNPITTVDHIGRINILPDTNISCTYRFSGCEHIIDRSIDPLKHVGQTREEFLSENRDYEIEQFSSNAVKLQCLRLGACPQHIMLQADETGQLAVYQADAETLEIMTIQTLPLYAAAFPSEIAEELYEGIVFSSIDQINEYLENAES